MSPMVAPPFAFDRSAARSPTRCITDSRVSALRPHLISTALGGRGAAWRVGKDKLRSKSSRSIREFNAIVGVGRKPFDRRRKRTDARPLCLLHHRVPGMPSSHSAASKQIEILLRSCYYCDFLLCGRLKRKSVMHARGMNKLIKRFLLCGCNRRVVLFAEARSLSNEGCAPW